MARCLKDDGDVDPSSSCVLDDDDDDDDDDGPGSEASRACVRAC